MGSGYGITNTTFVAHDGTSAAAPLSLSAEALVSSSSAVAVLSAKRRKTKKDNVKFNTSTQRIVTAVSDQPTADNSIRGVPGNLVLIIFISGNG